MWQVVRNGVWGMKMPFKFTEYKPSLDWFDTIHHEISEDDYTYFKLDRRYGHSWWLYGMKFDEKDFRWEEKEIGQIGEGDLRRFIEWAKFEEEKGGGSRIINIHMISGSFDIFAEVAKLVENQLQKENEELKRLNGRAMNCLRGQCKACAKYERCIAEGLNRKGSHFYCWEWKHAPKKEGEQK